MEDVFISYCTEDKFFAAGRGLEWVLREKAPEVTYWRDKSIMSGAVWSDEICNKLRSAKCVIVIWSENSWKSHWVRQEAFYAYVQGILVPMRVDNVTLEPPFNGLQTHWNDADGYNKLIAAVRQKIAAAQTTP